MSDKSTDKTHTFTYTEKTDYSIMQKKNTYSICPNSKYYIDMAFMLMDMDGDLAELIPVDDISYDRSVVLDKGDRFETDVTVNFMWRPNDEVITVTAGREIFPFEPPKATEGEYPIYPYQPEDAVLYMALRKEHANLLVAEPPWELSQKRLTWLLEAVRSGDSDLQHDGQNTFIEAFFKFYNRVLYKPNTLHADAMSIIEMADLRQQTVKAAGDPSLTKYINTIRKHDLGRCLVFPCTYPMAMQMRDILGGTEFMIVNPEPDTPITRDIPLSYEANRLFNCRINEMTGQAERTIPDLLPYASIKERLNEKFGYWKNAPSVLAACSTLNRAVREMEDVTARDAGYMDQALVLLDPGNGMATALNRSSEGRWIRNACYLIHLAHRISFMCQIKCQKYMTENMASTQDVNP